jgi:hypothetical protein
MRRQLACGAAIAAAAAGAAGAEMAAGEVIYDTLHFADSQTYDGANANALSGIGVFGAISDYQLCDDFATTELSVVTRITGDYVCFFGGVPAGGLQIDVFEDLGGAPAEDAIFSSTVPVTEVSSWHDPMYGLFGMRLAADVHIPLAPNTSYYLMLQAVDLTPQGDWYYQIYDNDSRLGGDRYTRNGGRGGNDFSWYTWRSAGNSGYGVGDVGMQVRAVPGVGSAAVLLGAGAWAAGRRRD